jgi:hypothetical protein
MAMLDHISLADIKDDTQFLRALAKFLRQQKYIRTALDAE